MGHELHGRKDVSLFELPAREVATAYPSQRIQLDDETRAQLLALEEQAFAATA